MTDRPGGATPPAGRRSAGRLHLSPRHRAQIVALLGEHLPGVDVWAYGSRITGESHDGSDLDLVLRAPDLQKIPIGRLSDLWEAVRESTIPFLVETRDWARLPEGFHGEIERDYVVLVEGARADVAGSTVDSEWVNSTIGEIADVSGGGTPSTKDISNFGGDIPWITPKDLSGSPDRYVSQGARNLSKKGLDNSAARLLPAGTVLLSTRAPIGYVAIAASPVTTNQGFRNLVLKDGFSPEFIYYWLTNNVPELERHATGSTFKEISGTAVKQINIPVPPFSEQRAIAHVLGALDDKIELNRRMNETLEAMARALFQSWFVDFDPVRARMEGRDTGLPKEIADLFPDRMVDSELGPIPDGWTTSALEDHLDATRGLSYKGSGLSETGLAMHNLNSVYEGGGYKYDGLKHYDGPYKDRHIVHPGEVIVANTEQGHDRLLVGHAAIVPRRYRSGLFTHHLYRVRVKDPLDAEYVCHMLNTVAMHDAVSGYATGTTVNMLPMDALRIPRILLPAPRIVAVFGTFAATVRGKAETIHDESENLARLRDALLPELVSGTLRVGRMAPPVHEPKRAERRRRTSPGRKPTR